MFGKAELDDLSHPFFSKGKYDDHKNYNLNEKKKLDLSKDDKIIVFTPHPDDEILGACTLLNKCFNEKIDLKIVYMTSGKGGGVIDERKIEAINGISKINGNSTNLIFSNAPFYSKNDRNITKDDFNCFKEIIEEINPNKIFICADTFDPNGTHRKCYDILLNIKEKNIYNNIDFYFYFSVWYWPKYNEFTHFLNYDFELHKLKIYAMLEHKSQLNNGFMGGDPRPFYQRACLRDRYFGLKLNYGFCELFYSIE